MTINSPLSQAYLYDRMLAWHKEGKNYKHLCATLRKEMILAGRPAKEAEKMIRTACWQMRTTIERGRMEALKENQKERRGNHYRGDRQ